MQRKQRLQSVISGGYMFNRMKRLFTVLSFLSALLSGLLFIFLPFPRGWYLWYARIFAAAVAPFNALIGAVSAVGGVFTDSPLASVLGSISAVVSAGYVAGVTRSHPGFEMAYGSDWEQQVPEEIRQKWLEHRWTWRRPPPVGHPDFRRDVVFATLPGGRKLLCDLWLPPDGVKPTGVAFIYSHGSGWILLDKDYKTRPFFHYLASQGHVVMDIAYRLYPEADMGGMIQDIKHAIAWMKAHAAELGVDPARVVIGGGSAGAHLSLMAAYTANDPSYAPEDLCEADLSVRGVVSIYGPVDLEAEYDYTHQAEQDGDLKPVPPDELKPVETVRTRVMRRIGRADEVERLNLDLPPEAGAFVQMLGARPTEKSGVYARFSPLDHVHPGCPATLLIQGTEDVFVPLEPTHELYIKLRAEGIPAVMLVLPQTDHAYDLFLPSINPPAQSTLYDIERFLGMMAA